MRCLVTGASGFIGGHLARRLAASGADVTCLVRPRPHGEPPPSLPGTIVWGSLEDFAAVCTALEGVDRVYHVAGVLRGSPEALHRGNVDATAHLLEACVAVRPGLQRFVLVSSLAAYGPSRGKCLLTEDCVPAPFNAYGRTKRAAELLAFSFGDRLPVTVVRPPVVYGPGDRATLPVFRVVHCGLRPVFHPGPLLSLVHVDDLVDGLLLAGERPAAAGRGYFMSGDGIISFDDLLLLTARVSGRATIPVPVPHRAGWLAGAALEAWARLRRRQPFFDRAKAAELRGVSWCCDDSLARKELGYAPKWELAEGLARTAQWYRENGWL